MVLSSLIGLAAVFGISEGVRASQSKARKQEHRSRKCNLSVHCCKSSQFSSLLEGRRVVLSGDKLYIDTGQAYDEPFGHPFAGYYLPYPDSGHSGLVSTIMDDPPVMNWIYAHCETLELKFGPRVQSQGHHTGAWDCTRGSKRLTLGGWEGFVAVQEGPFWALYFDRDDNFLQGKVPEGTPVLEVELNRVEMRVKKPQPPPPPDPNAEGQSATDGKEKDHQGGSDSTPATADGTTGDKTSTEANAKANTEANTEANAEANAEANTKTSPREDPVEVKTSSAPDAKEQCSTTCVQQVEQSSGTDAADSELSASFNKHHIDNSSAFDRIHQGDDTGYIEPILTDDSNGSTESDESKNTVKRINSQEGRERSLSGGSTGSSTTGDSDSKTSPTAETTRRRPLPATVETASEESNSEVGLPTSSHRRAAQTSQRRSGRRDITGHTITTLAPAAESADVGVIHRAYGAEASILSGNLHNPTTSNRGLEGGSSGYASSGYASSAYNSSASVSGSIVSWRRSGTKRGSPSRGITTWSSNLSWSDRDEATNHESRGTLNASSGSRRGTNPSTRSGNTTPPNPRLTHVGCSASSSSSSPESNGSGGSPSSRGRRRRRNRKPKNGPLSAPVASQ